VSRKRLQRPKDSAPTVKTVADLAGVSIASASRVLNGLGASAETTRRVREAADQVGYVPNALGRSLQSQRTGLLALAVADIGNPVYVEMMRAIEDVAKAGGYQLLVHATGADPDAEVALIQGLARRYVDGLILSPLRLTERHLVAMRTSPVPVIVVGKLPDDAPHDNVRADSHAGVALAIRHLAAIGRRRIAFVNGAPDTSPAIARLAAYQHALTNNGLAYDETLVEFGDFQYAQGRDATARLLDRCGDPAPDAIFCANDLIAAGALHELLTRGMAVPDDVALVGMDDTALATMTFPQLTSVSLGAAERGRHAAELMLTRLVDPDLEPRRISVDPVLAVRQSCGALAATTASAAATAGAATANAAATAPTPATGSRATA
jgi:LacI family transcriptional regulator